jgi:hypothetical protein
MDLIAAKLEIGCEREVIGDGGHDGRCRSTPSYYGPPARKRYGETASGEAGL